MLVCCHRQVEDGSLVWSSCTASLPESASCVNCHMQVAVEDGLVGVDVALPDYKLALFLDGSHQSVSAAQSHLTTLDPDGSMLSG